MSVGSATTGPAGGFRIRWRPRRSGTYLITAALPHPGHGYLPDRSCDLVLAAR